MSDPIGTVRTHRSRPWKTLALTLAAGLLLGPTGCADDAGGTGDAGGAGSSPDAPTSPDPGATPGQSRTPDRDDASDREVEVFEFEITGGSADPPLERVTVPQGATVRIVVTADEPDELHLHGYDLDAALEPGEQAVLEFVADQPGLFELETHHGGLPLLQLAVR